MTAADLSNKQIVQLRKAPANQKARLAAAYDKQNRGLVPGTPYDQKGAARRRQNAQVGYGPIRNMPRGSNPALRGSMPDMSKGNWGQTPASSNVVAPRGFGYYDAFEHDPFSVATHMSIGPATPIVGATVCNRIQTLDSAEIVTTAGDKLEGGMQLLIIMPATEDVQAVLYACNGTTAATNCTATYYRSTQLSKDPPDNAIPTRCSMRIRNWTQSVGVGGIVRVLRMTTGIALSQFETSNEGLARLCEEIRVHTRTRVYGGDELLDVHQKNCTIVDQSKATWFEDFQMKYQNSNVPWTAKVGWDQTSSMGTFTKQIHDPAYTPIAILFEPFTAQVSGATTPVGNIYEVNIRSQFLGHYTQGTMLANMAVCPPTNPTKLGQHRDREEAKGATLEKVGNALKTGVSWAWNSGLVNQIMPRVAPLALTL